MIGSVTWLKGAQLQIIVITQLYLFEVGEAFFEYVKEKHITFFVLKI